MDKLRVTHPVHPFAQGWMMIFSSTIGETNVRATH